MKLQIGNEIAGPCPYVPKCSPLLDQSCRIGRIAKLHKQHVTVEWADKTTRIRRSSIHSNASRKTGYLLIWPWPL